MQSAFFKLAKVIPMADAVKYLKKSIVKEYGIKGEKIVSMNHQAVDAGMDNIHQVSVPADWATAKDKASKAKKLPKFIEEVLVPMNAQKGDDLPASTFKGIEDGTFPSSSVTSAHSYVRTPRSDLYFSTIKKLKLLRKNSA